MSEEEVAEALDRGLAEAERLRRRGLIEASALFLGGEARICGVVLRDEHAGHKPLRRTESILEGTYG